MVVYFSGGRFSGTHGYAHAPGGISAIAPRPSAIRPSVDAFIESHYAPGTALPVALLLQLDRVRGEYVVTFEDADVSRWKVTPANLNEIRERLRPSFE